MTLVIVPILLARPDPANCVGQLLLAANAWADAPVGVGPGLGLVSILKMIQRGAAKVSA